MNFPTIFFPLLALVALLPRAEAATTTLVPAGSAWKYLDTGANLGTAWRTNSFNDAGWVSGPAPLGYGEMNVGQWPATTNSFGPDANNKFITTYYRRTFSVTNAAGVSMLQLRLLRDDGAVVYLNGVEVFRSNLPTGAVTYTTLASAAVGTTDETNFFQTCVVLSHLREGTNLLAVEVHQAAVNSSDLAFDLALNAIHSDAREKWRGMKYGIFSHYTYGATGNGDVNDAANAFNAAAYANDVEAAGAQYVVWTAWHGNMFPMFPSQAAAKYGYASRCSTRDTVSDMIDAVKAKGLRVLLYTHPYQPLTTDLTVHNNYINELYAEVIDRYGARIDGLWLDENQIQANQDSLVDYKRLLRTVRERARHLVTMQNNAQLYTTDMGGPEIVGSWNFGWSECLYILANPGGGPGAEDMLRTTVLEAAANYEGGGIHWSVDGKAYEGLVETNRVHALGRYLAPIMISITNTQPSTAFPPPYHNGRSISPGDSNWFATESLDGTKVFIHVLTALASNTLTLPTPADGKTFTNATLLASLQIGAATQQVLNAPVTLLQTPRGIQLTLTGTNTWSALDTVIQLDVASPGGAGLVNDASASVNYTGASWTYQSHRGLGEFADDAHTATANGDAFTLAFSGTEVSFISSRGANRGGVDLYVDDVFQTNVNLAVATTNRDVVFAKSGLPRGTHTLKGVKTSGAYLVVDAFKVIEIVNDSDADLSGSFPTTRSLGSSAASYAGPGNLWQPGGSAGWITPSVSYEPARALTDTNPPSSDYFTFTFTGTGAQCSLSSAFSWAYFFLTVDGIFQTNFQVAAGSVRTFTVANLPMGTHTLKGITWKATTDPSQPGVTGFTVTRPDMWLYQTNRNLGEHGNDVHYSDVNGLFNYSFTGSGVDVIVSRDENARMTWYGVSGMGTSTGARRQNYSESFQAGGSVFGLPNLVPGSHTVTAQNGANNSGMNFSYVRLNIDALRIYKGESLSSTPLFWGATGAGGSGTWNVDTTANWFDGGAATRWYDFGGTDYAAVFGGAAGTVSVASGVKVNRLTFNTTGYTLQNNPLTLNGSFPTITIASNVTATISSVLAGAAGLRKDGPGTLRLSGANTYTGTTTVSDGTLSGSGVINGPLVIASVGALEPGSSTNLNETLTLNSSLTLAGAARFQIGKPGGTPASDRVVCTGNITYGGRLIVTNATGAAWNAGDSFALFAVSGAPSGNFTNIIVQPPLDGLNAVFNPGNGTLLFTTSSGFTPLPMTFVTTGAVWKYFAQTNDLGATWRSNSFNDASWSGGPAMLGFGDANGLLPTTTVASNRQWTTYFRRAFLVPQPALVQSLGARIQRDDGAVVYLNGSEIWRDTNMPSGVITNTTPALSALSTTNETLWLPFSLLPSHLSLLTSGTNLLAIEVHQNALTSSDLAMNFELTGTTLVSTNTPLSLSLDANSLRLSWPVDAGPFTLHSTTNFAPPVLWTPLTNTPGHVSNEWRVTLPAATNGQRYFRLQTP
jgi:autotransporter-associated beta strand protein